MKPTPNTAPHAPDTATPDIRPFFRPASVAIIGMSSKPGSAGQVVLANLLNGGYQGPIHLVGRSGGMLDGRPVLTDISQLPDGIELAILMLPSEAVRDAVQACVAKGIRGAVCFASGFAEMGEAGRQQQQEIAAIARAGGLALLGPNTVGYFNYADAFYVMMVPLVLPPRLNPEDGPAIAIVAQSGGVGAHIAASLLARGVPLSYMMTTGNEAQTGLAEMVRFYAADPYTGAIVIYAEQIRSAADFLDAARAARTQGKPVIMLHPGRSEQSQAAAQSHTGALAGNHAAMRLMARHAGVLVVDTLEEVIDVGQLMLRYPTPPTGGLGLVTASGAICGLAQDYVDTLGLAMPPLSPAQAETLRGHLPAFLPSRNPLDIGTLSAYQPSILETGVAALLADPGIGSLLASMPMPEPAASVEWLNYFLAGAADSGKPAIYVMQNEDTPPAADFIALARKHRAVIMRSPERALRALACVTRFGLEQSTAQSTAQAAAQTATHTAAQTAKQPAMNTPGAMAAPAATATAIITSRAHASSAPPEPWPAMAPGAQAEWLGKQVLRTLSIATPPGDLARSLEDALHIAAGIGYPVALKAQAAHLTHKSDAGGVLLNIADADALRAAWQTLQDNIRRAAPDVELDGALVEKMGARGLELVVGASRDPQWGPILMVGLGGIWVEALGDVQLLPPDLPQDAIISKLLALKGHQLLRGFRGQPAVDLPAVAKAVAQIGHLMLTRPEIAEIDINPLVAYPEGQGVMALDALLVTR
ncbi:acetate--CoA ligase family protein [Pseudomonas sp. S 311-6]|uniref:acetate--CoA ligase family protein n=1 Tax=Kerstersia gyiorum TaxID=206506 RepID=UPI00209717FB|nr:acetate--CoA ligase family protein [Pseudomonas sp. S 311-6]